MLLGVEFYDAWKYVGIDAGVKAIKDAGFDTMDMSYQLDAADFFLGEDYIEKALEVKAALKKYNLKCNQAHGPIETYYGMKFDDSCPEYVRTCRAMESASIIGIQHIVVEGIEVPAPHSSYLNLENNYRYYKSLEPLCEKYGITIAIENLRKSFTYPDLMNEILRKLNSPWFKALVDMGHCWVRADMQPGEYIRSLDPGVICGLHIHDTHGIRQGVDEHLLPWLAEVDFDDAIRALKEVGYAGDLTLEIRMFLDRYAKRGLLQPALAFSQAVGRKLVEMYEA